MESSQVRPAPEMAPLTKKWDDLEEVVAHWATTFTPDPDKWQGVPLFLSRTPTPEATLLSEVEVVPDKVLKTRIAYMWSFQIYNDTRVIKVGSVLAYLCVKPGQDLAKLPDAGDFAKELVDAVVIEMDGEEELQDKKYDDSPRRDQSGRFGLAMEVVQFARAFHKKKSGELKKPTVASRGHWPQAEDSEVFIQKIQMEPGFEGRGLLKPILDHIFKSLGAHPELPAHYKVSGNISWIVEPGVLPSAASMEIWEKHFESQKITFTGDSAEEDKTNYIIAQLKKVYERCGFHVAFKGSIGQRSVVLHVYMICRTRATVSPGDSVYHLPWESATKPKQGVGAPATSEGPQLWKKKRKIIEMSAEDDDLYKGDSDGPEGEDYTGGSKSKRKPAASKRPPIKDGKGDTITARGSYKSPSQSRPSRPTTARATGVAQHSQREEPKSSPPPSAKRPETNTTSHPGPSSSGPAPLNGRRLTRNQRAELDLGPLKLELAPEDDWKDKSGKPWFH